jgi:hypothetical protein
MFSILISVRYWVAFGLLCFAANTAFAQPNLSTPAKWIAGTWRFESVQPILMYDMVQEQLLRNTYFADYQTDHPVLGISELVLQADGTYQGKRNGKMLDQGKWQVLSSLETMSAEDAALYEEYEETPGESFELQLTSGKFGTRGYTVVEFSPEVFVLSGFTCNFMYGLQGAGLKAQGFNLCEDHATSPTQMWQFIEVWKK